MSAAVHQLILASAGTGKTYRLSNRFLALLVDGVEPARILATTFTRKAAGEILDRILERLVEAVESDEKRVELAAALERPGLTAQDCRALLSRLARGLDTLQVRTIDSFFVHLVRLFALDLELPPGWRIASESEDEVLRAEAIQDVLERVPRAELLELLRDMASGGFGRNVHQGLLEQTRSMRSIHLESADGAWTWLDPGPRPDDDALGAAVESLREEDLPKTKAGAPHKSWSKVVAGLKEQIERADWGAVPSNGLVKKLLQGESSYSNHPITEELAAKLAPVLQRAVHEYLFGLAGRNRATHALLERFEAAYAELKRGRGCYRFDDLPLALAPGAGSPPPLDARQLDLWFRLDSRIDHLLLDEFQDTSPLQWRVLERIASEIAADGSGERSFFCVGDVKQSIYGFRQAEPRLLEELPRMLPGLEPEPMQKSWRSSAVVLETVNALFSGIEESPALGGEDDAPCRAGGRRWQRRFQPHQAARELPGAAFLVEARSAVDGEKEDQPLLERAVERVCAIVAEAPAASVGLLLRERKHIPGLIYRLRQRGVDASGEGGSALTDSEAVLAFVSLLHLADHPDDSAAAFHVARSPLGAYVELPAEHDDACRREVARAVRARLQSDGLGALCAGLGRRIAGDTEAWSAWDLARFEQLTELAFGFGARPLLRTSDFVDHVRGERVESPGGAQVRVMTVHGAKGLEFDAVVLPDLRRRFVARRDRLLFERPRPESPIERVTLAPNKDLRHCSEELARLYDATTTRLFEDDLCNLYVATTRAARRLDLIVPHRNPDEEKKWKPTHADFVRAALAQGELHAPDAEGVIWSHPRSTRDGGWAATERAGAQPPAPAPDVASLGLAPSRLPRTPPRRSPSAEEGGQRVAVASLLGDRRGARRGTLVHRLLEELDWLEDFVLDEALAGDSLAALEPDPGLRREAFLALERALAAEPVRRALSRAGCRAPADAEIEVARERAFSLLLRDESGEEQLWSGVIDRLVLARRGDEVVFAEVLDYKTDAIGADRLQERTEYYRPQLQGYGRVVAAQTGLPAAAIGLRLVFLEAGRVVDVEPA